MLGAQKISSSIYRPKRRNAKQPTLLEYESMCLYLSSCLLMDFSYCSPSLDFSFLFTLPLSTIRESRQTIFLSLVSVGWKNQDARRYSRRAMRGCLAFRILSLGSSTTHSFFSRRSLVALSQILQPSSSSCGFRFSSSSLVYISYTPFCSESRFLALCVLPA